MWQTAVATRKFATRLRGLHLHRWVVAASRQSTRLVRSPILTVYHYSLHLRLYAPHPSVYPRSMPTYFNFSVYLQSFLFSGLSTDSWRGIFGLSLAVFSLSVFYEALRLREVTCVVESAKAAAHESLRREAGRGDEYRGLEPVVVPESKPLLSRLHKIPWCWRLLLTLMYTCRSLLGYILMLSVMSFNVYIFLGVLLGAGLGYLVFGLGLIERGMRLKYDGRSIVLDNSLNSGVEDSGSTVREIL